MHTSTITITFGEKVENHIGNQQIGNYIEDGITYSQLEMIKKGFDNKGYQCELIDLQKVLSAKIKENIENIEKAGILVIKNFANTFLKDENASNKLFHDLTALDWDKKCLMDGKVKNKKARYNLCFADFSQEPNYEAGKGKVYNFSELEILEKIRKCMNKIARMTLNAEGNYYYDKNKCYIKFHGDTERKIVIGLRLGATFPLFYQWFKNDIAIIEHPIEINLEHGDLYIMSSKAVGNDWKNKNIFTLRHAAGRLGLK
jgi:hypothetical protein